MDLHECCQDLDEDTALNCIELGQALDSIADTLVDGEVNTITPIDC